VVEQALTARNTAPDFDKEVLTPLRASQAAEKARLAALRAAQAVAAAKAEELARKQEEAAETASEQAEALPAGTHQDWMAAAGIAAADYGFVEYIVSHESGWQVSVSNYSGSGAYGLGQALPASKMAPYGADYLTNPVTQLRWAQAYAVNRYGSWQGAYEYWTAHSVW
jgi:hypothetical protein